MQVIRVFDGPSGLAKQKGDETVRLNGQILMASALVLLLVPAFSNAADKIKIKATEPKASRELSRGQETKLRITVEYALESAEAGAIALVVQAGQTILATVDKPPIVPVKRGRGKLTLETVLQPLSVSTSYVGVFVSLIAQPRDLEGPGPHRLRTSTVDQIAYTVR